MNLSSPTAKAEIGWPMLSFGPINLWRVAPAWRLGGDVHAVPSAHPVAPQASARGVNPKVARLLSLR